MRVRFYAAGREIAGVPEVELDARSLMELRAALLERFDDRMARLLAIATLLHDGARHRIDDDITFGPDATIDVLPPFAGG